MGSLNLPISCHSLWPKIQISLLPHISSIHLHSFCSEVKGSDFAWRFSSERSTKGHKSDHKESLRMTSSPASVWPRVAFLPVRSEIFCSSGSQILSSVWGFGGALTQRRVSILRACYCYFCQPLQHCSSDFEIFHTSNHDTNSDCDLHELRRWPCDSKQPPSRPLPPLLFGFILNQLSSDWRHAVFNKKMMIYNSLPGYLVYISRR